MKTSLPILALLLAALTLGGCSTVDRRIKEKEAVFAALPLADQQRLRRGVVAVGDSFEAVYIALGKPDERRERRHAKANETVWIYKSYWESYEGRAFAGYRRYVIRDPHTQRAILVQEPVYTNVYRAHVDDRIRIEFSNGRVTAIEQQKR